MARVGERGVDLKPRKKRQDAPRAGPGRPPGLTDALPRGAVGAIMGLRHRVPEGTPEPLGEAADEAFETVVEVMRGKHRFGGMQRLSAARIVREEVCGQIAQKHEVNVVDNLAERMKRARERRASGGS